MPCYTYATITINFSQSASADKRAIAASRQTDGRNFGIVDGLVTAATRRVGQPSDHQARSSHRDQVTNEKKKARLFPKSLPTFRTWPLRKLSSSSAVAVKSCFAIASILPPGRRSRRETGDDEPLEGAREGARYNTGSRTVRNAERSAMSRPRGNTPERKKREERRREKEMWDGGKEKMRSLCKHARTQASHAYLSYE